MEVAAVQRVCTRLGEVVPAWLTWREEALRKQAEFSGDLDSSARAMREIWRRNLLDVEEQEAMQVLDRVAVGRLKLPPYSDLPVFLRRESLATRPDRAKQRLELQFADEPRFRCLHCRDTGTAWVLDADFTSRYRTLFSSMTGDDFADCGGSWYHRAKSWWRRESGSGKIDYAVACACAAGQPRQESMSTLDPTRQPVLHSKARMRETLQKWYEQTEPAEVVYWEVGR